MHKLLDSANISATWENPPEPEEILEKDNQRILEDPIFSKKSQVEGYQRHPERDTRSARQRRMDDPDKGINSQAFRDFMAAQQRPSKPKKKKEVKENIFSKLVEADKKGKGSGTKDACYNKVKASAKVWPSAYASGRLVQCRKKGAANYGKGSD